MRTALVSLAVAVAAVSLASCGSSDDEGGRPPAADSSVFPVTVTHRLGTTTVPTQPRRIASSG
jgi:iron complex transport system substrate-binding protein